MTLGRPVACLASLTAASVISAPGVGEEERVDRAWRQLTEPGSERLEQVVGVDVRLEVDAARRLLGDRGDDLRVAVAGRVDRDAGREVEVLLAVDGRHPTPAPACHLEVGHLEPDTRQVCHGGKRQSPREGPDHRRAAVTAAPRSLARGLARLTNRLRRSRCGPPARPAAWRGRCRSARAAGRAPGRARAWLSAPVPTMRWAEATSMSDVSVHTWRSCTSTTPSTAPRSARSASRSVPGGAACTRMRSACPARRMVRGTIHSADGDADDRIDPRPAGELEHDRADDDADRPDGVGEHLEVRALDVQRLLRRPRAAARTRRGWRSRPRIGDDEHRARRARRPGRRSGGSPRRARTRPRRAAAPRWRGRRGSRGGRAERPVRALAEPRPARWMAASAMPMPITSVSMWPASDSRASELVTSPPTTSTTMNATSTHEGGAQPPLCRSPADSETWECEWPLPDPWSWSSTGLQDASSRRLCHRTSPRGLVR